MGIIQKIFGTRSEREVKKLMPLVTRIESMEDEMMALTDEQHDLLTQAALTDKQTRRLEELVSQWREAYDIETHPEWLTFYDE